MSLPKNTGRGPDEMIYGAALMGFCRLQEAGATLGREKDIMCAIKT